MRRDEMQPIIFNRFNSIKLKSVLIPDWGYVVFSHQNQWSSYSYVRTIRTSLISVWKKLFGSYTMRTGMKELTVQTNELSPEL